MTATTTIATLRIALACTAGLLTYHPRVVAAQSSGFGYAVGAPVASRDSGGGADRWLAAHAGIRLEAREQFVVSEYGFAPVTLAFRIGVVVR